jgi:gamma-glutamyltranspeptidase/glutathione hydrolase
MASVLENFNSRRSEIYSTKGICTSSQPLASAVGVKILQEGGNAADACVAMAAALNVLEPCSTGIGGDAFALYYDAKTKKVSCLQGNGSSPSGLTMEMLAARGIGCGPEQKRLDKFSGLAVTVPGAPMLWEDTIKSFGNKSLADVLLPAIILAEEGFPISPMTAEQWAKGFLQGEESNRVLRPNGKNPIAGEVLYNPDLAKTFRILGERGAKEGFYRNEIAQAIVAAVQAYDGVLTLEDLNAHETSFEEPISILYKGYRIFETPPPTQGLAALIALSLLDKAAPDTSLHSRGSELQAHVGIEAMRLAFADALNYLSDPRHHNTPVATLLSDDYISKRAAFIKDSSSHVQAGDASEFRDGDTVYFCCIDRDGNGCSMINSNYMHFGTGIMPTNCGFTIQNRGFNFSLQPGHLNELAPKKRPYHTIIPCLITRESDGSLFSTLGNMGKTRSFVHTECVSSLCIQAGSCNRRDTCS